MANRNVQQVAFNPKDLGLNGVTFASVRNSTAIGVGGFNQMTVQWEVTRVAATDLSFYIAFRAPGGTNYGQLRVGDIDYTTGIETTARRQIVVPTMATTANQTGTLHFPINSEGNMRLEDIVGTSATTDTLLMWITLGVV